MCQQNSSIMLPENCKLCLVPQYTIPNSEKVYTFLCFCFFPDVSQSNTDLLSGLGGVFSSVPPAPLANNAGHSSVLFTTNHNLNPLEATFTSPGEYCLVLHVSRKEIQRNCMQIMLLFTHTLPVILDAYLDIYGLLFYPVLSIHVQLLFEKNYGFLFVFTSMKYETVSGICPG